MSTDPLTNNSYLVTPETIEHFLMHMLRDEHLFNVGLTHLDQTFLNRPDEAPYGIIWKTAREYHGQFHRRPSGESLSSMVMSRLPLYGRVKQEDVDKLASVLGFIYDTPDSQLDPTLALEYLKAFLRDRRLGDRMERETSAAPLQRTRLSHSHGRATANTPGHRCHRRRQAGSHGCRRPGRLSVPHGTHPRTPDHRTSHRIAHSR